MGEITCPYPTVNYTVLVKGAPEAPPPPPPPPPHTHTHTHKHTHTHTPGSKVHGTNMGPTWGRQDPGGPHVGPMSLLAIWAVKEIFFWTAIDVKPTPTQHHMMTSSNGNIFRVTGPLWGESTGGFHSQRPVARSFDVFFDLRLNKRLSKQLWGRWFETL